MKSGDVVQMKSGGPKMTVEVVKNTTNQGEVISICRCKWFVDNRLEEGDFVDDTLNIV